MTDTSKSDDNAPQVGRPRQYDEAEVKRALMKLFWERGYEGTSLSQIMKVTGLAKASLYGMFANKRDMYYAALGNYLDEPLAHMRRELTSGAAPERDRLKAFLSAPMGGDSHAQRLGCFLCRAAADQAPIDDRTEKLVMRGLSQIHGDLIIVLKDIGARQPEDLASSYLSLYTGLRTMRTGGAPAGHLEKVVNMALRGL